MKLKTGLFALLLLSAAGYAGAKFYLHAQVNSKLDELVRIASPFVMISYGKISSDLRGKLWIENIGLKTSDGAVLQIGGIELEGPGPRFLWSLAKGFKDSAPPSRLALKLTDVSIPVDQSFRGSFGPITLGGDNTSPGSQPCTLGGLLKHAGLERLGIDTLSASSVMGYNLDQSNGDAWVFLDYELAGMDSLSLAMSLRGIPEPGAVVMGAMPRIADIDLSYSLQSGHIKRMVEYCSRQSQQTSEQFLDAVFNQSDNEIARNLGFVPGPGIKQMLRKLVTDGGTVQLKANPPDSLDPATLSAYKTEDLMRLLKVKISLDDKPVKDLRISFVSEGEALSGPLNLSGFGIGTQDSAAGKPSDDSDAEEADVQEERRRMRYVETGISDLRLYIGSRVKLYTVNSSKPKQGFLSGYKGNTFSVEQKIHGGTMTAHVRDSEIARAEVLRPVP